MATIKDIAEKCGVEERMVRKVLKEDSTFRVSKETADKIFTTARELGYDLKKLKLGKRMDLRKVTVNEVLEKLDANPDWKREDIITYLKTLTGMVDRVQKRAFPDEFGEDTRGL